MADQKSSSRFLQSLRQRTQQRRGERRRRKRTTVLVGFVLIAMVAVALPSIGSALGWGHRYLNQATAGTGLTLTAESMQFGWITPVRLVGVEILGESGETKAFIESIDTELTLLDCMGSLESLGQISIRGVQAEVAVADGRSSLEDDLAEYFQAESHGATPTATIELHDASVTVSDVGSGTAWFAGNIQSTIKLSPQQIEIQGTSVITDPAGASGALEIGAVVAGTAQTLAPEQPRWQTDLRLRNAPLHIVTLLKRRFPSSTASLPDQLSGDASGVIRLTQYAGGSIAGVFNAVEFRKLVAADRRLGARTWANEFASLQGSVVYQDGVITAQQLQAGSDFGKATMTGNFPLPTSSKASLAWVETISGNGAADIDLAKLDQAAPGLLPLRSGANITDGRITGKIESGPASDGQYRTVCSVRSTPIRGRAAGRPIVLEPITADATLVLHNGAARAERILLSSAFGSASGQGDLRSGTGRFDVDFSRLATMLRPLIELPEAGLQGTAKGNLGWSAGPGDQWKLSGDLAATALHIQLPGGKTIHQPSLTANVDATGVWSGDTLAQLNQLTATMRGEQQDWHATLLKSVHAPMAGNPLPLRIKGSGACASLAQLVGAWLPPELHSIDGTFTTDLTAEVARESGRLTAATLDVQQPRGGWRNQFFTQPYLKIRFEGAYAWPAGDLTATTLSVEGAAVTLAAVGRASAESAELELGWRMDLQRLQSSVTTMVAQQRVVGGVQQVSYVPANSTPGPSPYRFEGRCEGSAKLHGNDGIWSIDTDASGANLAILQATAAANANFVGPVRVSHNSAPSATELVWSEPTASVRGVFRYDATTGGAVADKVEIASEWFNTTVDGHVIWNETLGEVSLKGPSQINMALAARPLQRFIGQPVQLEGLHNAPLDLLFQRRADGQISADIRGSIGWQKGSVAGVAFGASTAELKITEATTTIGRTTIPVERGQLHIGGQVHYGNGPLRIEQQAGPFAENIRLEPEMARKWLKYLAPLTAETTDIAGTVSVNLTQCVVIPDDARQSHVAGQLSVQGVELNAGPLANQVIAGVDQLKQLSRGLSAAPQPARTRRLLTLPPQVVEFELRDAIVTHQRMYFNIDDAQVITSGSVALDGRLNLTAQVPLDARWLGSDVQSLAGQTVSLPISGTLTKPSLSTAAIAQVVGNLAIQAGQQTAENYLQQQMNRGLEKLLGR